MQKGIPPGFRRYLAIRRRAELAGDETSGITLRAVSVGSALALGIGISMPYASLIIRGSDLSSNFSTPVALFAFFVFVGLINVLLGHCRPSLALNSSELAVVYIMAMLATPIPTVGFTQYLLPIIAGVRYYASAENEWARLLHPHLPDWLTPQDAEAIRHFFEGLPRGASIPWEAWVRPLAHWGLFALALYWVSICAMAILRRQWAENEKVLYPLVQIPLDMLQEDERRSLIRPFFRKPVMWFGFAIPFFIGTINAVHNYWPAVARISTSSSVALFDGAVSLRLDINLALIGFAFLLSREMALSFWLFFLLATCERGAFNVLGIKSTETLSRFAGLVGPHLAHQAMGAMIALVLPGLWAARRHLAAVFRTAFGSRPGLDDTEEILSYRAAVWGLLIGLGVMGVWLWRCGIPGWVVPIFLFGAFVIFIALTRAVTEGGISVIRTPIIPADFVVSGLGSSALGPSGLTGLAFTYVWSANLRIFFMPCFANALKLADGIRGSKRRLLVAVILAIVLALGGSVWTVLTLAYGYGGANLNSFYFASMPQIYAFGYLLPKFDAPVGASPVGWGFTGLGAGFMGLLIYARYRLAWWPVHPLGFATGTFYIMNWVWFSVLLAWAAKTAVLRLGGASGYTQTRPFFLGLILGQVVVSGMWLVIDFFTGKTGNSLGYF